MNVKYGSVFCVEFCKSSLVKCLTYLSHKLVVEPKVMKNAKTSGELFASLEKVANICSGIVFAGRTLASGRDGALVIEIFLVEKIKASVPG